MSTQEDRLVWEAGIQALRRKEGSRVVGLELGLRLGLGLISGLRVKLRARVRVRVGVNDVAAVVEFLVLVLLVHGIASCVVCVVYKHYPIQKFDDGMALSQHQKLLAGAAVIIAAPLHKNACPKTYSPVLLGCLFIRQITGEGGNHGTRPTSETPCSQCKAEESKDSE